MNKQTIDESFEVQYQEYKPLPEGVYKAQITDIELVKSDYTGKDQLKFTFTTDVVPEGEVAPAELMKWINVSLSKKSTLFQLVKVISPEKDFKSGDVFQPLELMKEFVQLVVKHKESDDGNLYPRIVEFLPIKDIKK